MDDHKPILQKIMIIFFSAVFLISGALLARDLIRSHRQQKVFDQLSARFPAETSQISSNAAVRKNQDAESSENQPALHQENMAPPAAILTGEVPAGEWKIWWESQAENRFPVYQSLQQKNPHMIGWIRIENTVIDYPVCHTPDQPDYYLHRDFNGKRSSYGTPYLESCCRLDDPSTNLLIYGHHMKNGSMFAALQNYTDPVWYGQHPYIQFDTIDSAGSYEVAAVALLSHAGGTAPWQQLLFPDSEEDFKNAWKTFRASCFYDTGIDLTPDDELLALVTCEYTRQDGRLMVIARRIL